MTRILAVTASPTGEHSVSNRLAERFLETWRAADPAAEITRRDLGAQPLPHLDGAAIAAIFTPEADRSDDQRSRLQASDAAVDELFAADVIVIATPMHNFTIASTLKTWIDHVTRVGRTFNYTETGPQGLLTGKRVYVLGARGGDYSETSPLRSMDFQTPYLKQILAFNGLTDVTFIHAEGVAKGEDGTRAAEATIDETVAAAAQPDAAHLAAEQTAA